VKKTSALTFCFFLFSLAVSAQQKDGKELKIVNAFQQGAFSLVNGKIASSILIDTADAEVVRLASKAITSDIELITGAKPAIISTPESQTDKIIIAGTIGESVYVDDLIKTKKLDVSKIQNKWESFIITTVNTPMKGVKQALVIAGSDKRGTAYGLFEISRMIGVSPWVWWADVIPTKRKNLFVTPGSFISNEPAVKYRGIFLNDEDWGLQPWAAKTFEPETADIGPKTYSKIFELLLRLKANLIWPAMHPSTKAFFHYPGNKKVAADYSIIIGSSHAEPMLRNNVDEWNEKTMGRFNYVTNKATVQKYWEDRVKESSSVNAMYTMGMRGVHDSKMEGVNSPKEAVPLLELIFEDQRKMLQTHIDNDITAVPQVFTAYKEVLEIYDSGLKLPEDITIVWPDDNYGYIQRLANENEQKRVGGTGVYYHTSYWGRPHDYLWINGTHPSLVREEMMKAYEMKADKLWVLNVGDIKPHEYNTELFMDMAFNPLPFKDSKYSKQHLLSWLEKIFGKGKAQKIQTVLWEYHQLAFERRPEFMGWSRTEPTTQTKYSEYNHFYYGDEAQKRIDKYEALVKEVKALRTQMVTKDADAFYQLVYYPVVGASLMNKKFLYRDKVYLYAKQNRASAFDYAALSKQAYDSIVAETEYYNNSLANGKWMNMMSMIPRNLPVYQEPVLSEIKIDRAAVWNIAPEGFVRIDSSLISGQTKFQLPEFDNVSKQRFFVDIFLNDDKLVNWTTSTSANWIVLSKESGTLRPEFGKKEMRIWVSIDWTKAPKQTKVDGTISFRSNEKIIAVSVVANNLKEDKLNNFKGFVEENGYISIHASNFVKRTNIRGNEWKVVDGLGHTGKSIEASPLQTKTKIDTNNKALLKTMSSVEYDFYTFASSAPEVIVYTLPTHPLNNNYSMRYAISIDAGPLQIVDFKTFGRSEEWKQNVLSNSASGRLKFDSLAAGKHVLKIYAIDPGVIIDRILINTGGLRKANSVIAETKLRTTPQ
jgi:hypothetical protein